MGIFTTERPKSLQQLKEERMLSVAEAQTNRQLLEAQRLIEQEEAVRQEELRMQEKERVAKEEKAKALEEANAVRLSSIANRSIRDAKIRLPKEGREHIIKRTILNMVMESLWVDDTLKNTPESVSEAFICMESIINKCDEATGTKFLSNMRNTKFLSAMDGIAMEAAVDCAKRIRKEAEEIKPLKINFHLNEDEAVKLDEKMDDLGAKQIAKSIKNKVLGVIKDEKEAGEIKAEIFKELDDVAKDEATESGENEPDQIAESLVGTSIEETMAAIQSGVVEESASSIANGVNILLKLADREAVARNFEKAMECYSGVIKAINKIPLRKLESQELETVSESLYDAVGSKMFYITLGTKTAKRVEPGKCQLSPKYDSVVDGLLGYCEGMCNACASSNIVTETVDDIRQRNALRYVNQRLNASIGSTLFESLMIRNTRKIAEENPVLESGVHMLESDMQNAALIQTILEYTVFETLNTLKVYDFDRDVLKRLKSM